MIGQIISADFQFKFTVLAVDAIDGCGPSNEMHCQSPILENFLPLCT